VCVCVCVLRAHVRECFKGHVRACACVHLLVGAYLQSQSQKPFHKREQTPAVVVLVRVQRVWL